MQLHHAHHSQASLQQFFPGDVPAYAPYQTKHPHHFQHSSWCILEKENVLEDKYCVIEVIKYLFLRTCNKSNYKTVQRLSVDNILHKEFKFCSHFLLSKFWIPSIQWKGCWKHLQSVSIDIWCPNTFVVSMCKYFIGCLLFSD